jgi:hypothetical protein
MSSHSASGVPCDERRNDRPGEVDRNRKSMFCASGMIAVVMPITRTRLAVRPRVARVDRNIDLKERLLKQPFSGR